MAEPAQREAAGAKAREPAPELSARRHEGLERRSDARGYGALLNGRAPGLQPVQPAPHRTGMPDRLKAGVEALSGLALDDVKVHYNSAKPSRVQAHAYTQGMEIHISPGQEQYLGHEAWHVVQQMQGRVPAKLQRKGTALNCDLDLEREADRMGRLAVSLSQAPTRVGAGPLVRRPSGSARGGAVVQCHFFSEQRVQVFNRRPGPAISFADWKILADRLDELADWDEIKNIPSLKDAGERLEQLLDAIDDLLKAVEHEWAIAGAGGVEAVPRTEILGRGRQYLEDVRARVLERFEDIPQIIEALGRFYGYSNVTDAQGLAGARAEMSDLREMAARYELVALTEHLDFTLAHVPAAVPPTRENDPVWQVTKSIAGGTVGRGNRRGSIDRTNGSSGALLALQRDEPGNNPGGQDYFSVHLKKAMQGVGLADAQGRISARNQARVSAYVAEKLGAGNCGEFADLVFVKIGPTANSWIATAHLEPEESNDPNETVYDHQFNLVAPRQLQPGAGEGQLQDTDVVIDAWFNYKIVNLSAFLQGGNPYNAALTPANVDLDMVRDAAEGPINLNDAQGAGITAAITSFRGTERGAALVPDEAAALKEALKDPDRFYDIVRVGKFVDDRRPAPMAPAGDQINSN